MRVIVVYIFVCLFSGIEAQNLVTNYSFEDFSGCPIGSGFNQIDSLFPWTSPTGGADVMNPCITEISTIPNYGVGLYYSGIGGEWPHSGNGFVGMYVWGNPDLEYANFREYISSPLSDSLSRKTYQIEFYVSLMDSFRYAISNFGAYFSKIPPPTINSPSDLFQYYQFTPQFVNSHSNILSNKSGWTKVSGRFTAEGGERYITIGNFASDIETNYIMVDSSTIHYSNGISPLNIADFAYYIIDDISVWEDTTTGLTETEQAEFKIYPNPAKDFITIEVSNSSNYITATIGSFLAKS